MKIIYVCTEGDYSDYHICGVFDDYELAEIFSNKFGCEIEEWQLNPFEHQLKKGYSPYFIRMAKDGETITINKNPSYGFENDKNNYGFDSSKNMYLHCFAKSEEHAVKIANERRTQLIAMNEWP